MFFNSVKKIYEETFKNGSFQFSLYLKALEGFSPKKNFKCLLLTEGKCKIHKRLKILYKNQKPNTMF